MPKGVYVRSESARKACAENAAKATEKSAEYWRGRSRSDEQRAEHSAAMRGRPAHNSGKPMSADQRQAQTTHGHSVGGVLSPTYISWVAMLQRCEDPGKSNYVYYGGRGIAVCRGWHDFSTFLADMGERPDGKELSRIDNDGSYEPGNVQWATKADNVAERNRRVSRRA